VDYSITRKERISLYDIIVVAETFVREGHYMSSMDERQKWSHCAYISYRKDAFKNIRHPALETRDVFGRKETRFDYYNSSVAELDWHGGITFYSENKDLEQGHIICKAGCDYQHYGDEHYAYSDNGDLLLKDMVQLAKDLISFETRKK